MSEPTEGPAPRPCPICQRPAVRAHRPFCSDRCRMVDLGRWFQGSYAIPAKDDEDEDEDGADPGDDREP